MLMGEMEVSHEIKVSQPLNFALLSLDAGFSAVSVTTPNRLDVLDSLRDTWGDRASVGHQGDSRREGRWTPDVDTSSWPQVQK